MNSDLVSPVASILLSSFWWVSADTLKEMTLLSSPSLMDFRPKVVLLL